MSLAMDGEIEQEDLSFLRRALRLAAKGRYGVSPNPMVGAVVVREGRSVGDGFHRQVGGPHAEVEALARAGELARGATLYVSLEPCCHHGRTPPCADAVIEAGIRRVVACHRDPNPAVAGRGFERLRAAGLEVCHGALIEQAIRLNWRFLVAQTLGRPAVTLKWAMSLDGKIATAQGESQWISSLAGRRWGLAEREEHDAILVGSGTALADDPRLNRRLGRAPGSIVRVVLDRRLRLPSTAALFKIPGPVLVYTRSSARSRLSALEAVGATCIRLPGVEPEAVMKDLRGRGIRSVLIEGGPAIHAAFSSAGVYDRVAVDLAPMLIGGEVAPGPLGGLGFSPLDQAPRLADLRLGRRGEDIIVEGFRPQCLPDLYSSVAG